MDPIAWTCPFTNLEDLCGKFLHSSTSLLSQIRIRQPHIDSESENSNIVPKVGTPKTGINHSGRETSLNDGQRLPEIIAKAGHNATKWLVRLLFDVTKHPIRGMYTNGGSRVKLNM
jgi:hypothetical protein